MKTTLARFSKIRNHIQKLFTDVMKQLQKYICFLYLAAIGISFQVSAQYTKIQEQEKKEIDTKFLKLKKQLAAAIKDGSSSLIAQKYLQLGTFYKDASMYNEAIVQYNNALFLVKEEDTLRVRLHNEIGKIYVSSKNNDKAKEYFNEGIAISLVSKYVRGEAVAKGLLGSCYEKEGAYLKALSYQKESLELFRQLKDPEGIAVVQESMGSIYEDLEQYELAYSFFEKAYTYFEKTEKTGTINVLNNLGDVNRKTGNYTSALEYTTKAYNLATLYRDMYQLRSAHKDLSKTYAFMGDYQKAFGHLLESEQINEELISSQNIHQLNTLQTVYETKQKEAQISLLLQQKKTSRAHQSLLLVSFGAILLLAGISLFYYTRKRKERSKLQEYKQRILKAELEKKAIEEKNLQREVHLKTATLSRYSLHLSQKNKILSDLSSTLTNIASRKNMDVHTNIKKLAKEINFDLRQEKEWDEFNNFFREIHPEFSKKLSSLSEERLSPAELRLGMLLRLNLSSKEIASILRVTPDSVRVARYRLRKKLPIDQKEELANFMIAL
ncbi:hypothetical protein AB832_04575 [Flavobacteriaceae bacterium (ex Bugula neritina AB1)]|nr:hypothetical protein AB832_04575 [Flavobacteriaceae bacterium (ex Bugula neritina AB1)]